MPPDDLGPGALVDRTYRVIQQIGDGAMGVVLLARDDHLDRDVALKVIRPELGGRNDASARLMSEARALARLHHPNVVGIHALGEHRGLPYIVMEYVPGKTLQDVIEQHGGGPVAFDEAIDVLDQICRGVTAIHLSGAIHRDLKPSNILMGPASRVVVADLGIARSLSDVDDDRMGSSGTPAYMAPETLARASLPAELAPRADVYSLGVIAYQLLVGGMPFDVGSQDARPPSALNATLPAMIDPILLAALVRDARRRTVSPDALRRALLAAALHERPRIAPSRLLVAGDDPDYRAWFRLALARTFRGAIVERVPDSPSALAAIDHAEPSVAILDLDMLGSGGLDLVASIRARPSETRVPVIVTTALRELSDGRSLRTLDIDGFLAKPFEPSQLVTMIRRLLSVPPEATARPRALEAGRSESHA